MSGTTEFTIQHILNLVFDSTNNRLNTSIGTVQQRFNDNVLLTFGSADGTDTDFSYDGTNMVIAVNSGGLILNNGLNLIGDTINTKMTAGLTINQGANDNECVTLKSSDVAHGVLDITETDTYFYIKKVGADDGGAYVQGFNEVTIGLQFLAVGVTDDTTKSTAGTGYFSVISAKKSAANVGAAGADANLVVFRDGTAATRFIFDQEGSGHADVAWVAYDAYDDLTLIKSVEEELVGIETPDKTSRRHALEDAGIIGKGSWHMERGKPRAMVNMSKLSMLHHGALLQIGQRLGLLEAKMLTDGGYDA